jgi:hypothetical protein
VHPTLPHAAAGLEIKVTPNEIVNRWVSASSFRTWRSLRIAPRKLLSVSGRTPWPPSLGNDLIPGNNLVPVLGQQEKDLERDTLKPQHMTATAEPPRTQVNLVALAEPERLLPLQLARKLWHTPWKLSDFTTNR